MDTRFGMKIQVLLLLLKKGVCTATYKTLCTPAELIAPLSNSKMFPELIELIFYFKVTFPVTNINLTVSIPGIPNHKTECLSPNLLLRQCYELPNYNPIGQESSSTN